MCLAAVMLAASLAPVRAADSPDLSTPKKAALVVAKAMIDEDMPTLRAASVGSDELYGIMEATWRRRALARQMQAVAVVRFGEAGKQVGADIIGPGEADLAAVAPKLQEAINGDTASVGPPGEGQATPLKKVDGVWKVNLLAMLGEPANVARQRAIAQAMEKIIVTTTDAIQAGRYATAGDAILALARAQGEAMRAAGPAAVPPGGQVREIPPAPSPGAEVGVGIKSPSTGPATSPAVSVDPMEFGPVMDQTAYETQMLTVPGGAGGPGVGRGRTPAGASGRSNHAGN
jgi:hypothetical protein